MITRQRPVKKREPIYRRSTLNSAELLELRERAEMIRSGEIDLIHTTTLNHIPEKKQVKPLVSFIVGFALMMLLLMIVFSIFKDVNYWWKHVQSGDRPVTHIDGYFGFQGENKDADTHVVAMNQNGDIIVIIVPPNTAKTTVIQLQSYNKFPLDEIPELSIIKFNGIISVEVTITDVDFSWILTKSGDTFAPLKM